MLWEAPPIPLGFYTQLLESHTTGLDGDRAPRVQRLGNSVASMEGDSVAGPEGWTKDAPLLAPHLACSPQHAQCLAQGPVFGKHLSVE